MMHGAELIRRERVALGLSTRQLARLAGLSFTTISRIENGHEEPRWETMQRIAAVLGKRWELCGDVELVRLADCSGPVGVDGEPDWTRLRGFVDYLRLRPELLAASIADAPAPSGSRLADNVFAAVAEKLASDAGLRPPSWVATIEPLRDGWEAPGTPRRVELAREQTAPQFARRGVTLPVAAIWRDAVKATA